VSDSLVTYNTNSKELRNIPEAFAERDDYVASIVWEKQVGDAVDVGLKLATIQWGEGTLEPLNAPEGCVGTVQSLNRDILYEDLEYAPSQLFAVLS